MTPPKCRTHEHEFRHLDVKHNHISPKYRQDDKTQYKRVDQFYCVRCLHIETVVREEIAESQPHWWNKTAIS